MRRLVVLLLLCGVLSRDVFRHRQGQFPSTLFVHNFGFDNDDFDFDDNDDGENDFQPQFTLPPNFPFQNFPQGFPFNNFPPNFPFHNFQQNFPFNNVPKQQPFPFQPGFPFRQFQRPGFQVQSSVPFVQTHVFPLDVGTPWNPALKRPKVEPVQETSSGFLDGFFNNLANTLKPTFSFVTSMNKLVDDLLPPSVMEKVDQLLEEKNETAHAQLKEEIATDIKERVDDALNVDSQVTVEIVEEDQDKPLSLGQLFFGPTEMIIVETTPMSEPKETNQEPELVTPEGETPISTTMMPFLASTTDFRFTEPELTTMKDETHAPNVDTIPESAPPAEVAAVPHLEAAGSPGKAAVTPGEAAVTPGEAAVTPGEAAVTPVEAADEPIVAANEVEPNTAEDLANLKQTPR